MRFLILLVFIAAFPALTVGQDFYFPPVGSNEWETIDPEALGWDIQKLDALKSYLEAENTKSFMVLKDGKIVAEWYMNGHAPDMIWYWASAGKSLTAFLTGMIAESDGLNIEAPVSDYIGQGWTSMSVELEDMIRVRHQLSMTTGLDYNVDDLNCTNPECLHFLNVAGTAWYYHNAPYTKIRHVLESVTGKFLNDYYYVNMASVTGMGGAYFWLEFNSVFFSRTRDMARFGLLMLNDGVWDGTPLINDADYFQAMITPSQQYNQAYGYLWWLNGSSSFMVPEMEIVLPGMLFPQAPADMYSALGRDGQILNIIPSLNMVVLRMGEPPSETGLFMLNRNIMEQLDDIMNTGTSVQDPELPIGELKIYPNPANNAIRIDIPVGYGAGQVEVFDNLGRKVAVPNANGFFDTTGLSSGVYLVRYQTEDAVFTGRFTVVK